VASGAGATTPCTGFYPNNLNSLLIYGPFDLRGATRAELSFWRWQRTELDYDFFSWLASVDGTNFYGWKTSEGSDGWEETWLDLGNVPTLGNLCGRSQVWIAFLLQSDGDQFEQGVFVDDVQIRKGTGSAPLNDLAPGDALDQWVPAEAWLE
jgi:hypothetical protein